MEDFRKDQNEFEFAFGMIEPILVALKIEYRFKSF